MSHKALPITLSASDFKVAYKNEIALSVNSLSCTGKVVAIIGHNGAGKSTFIKSILKLIPPSHGRLTVTRGNETLIPEKDMAFCPETGSVFTDISVEEYLAFWCRVKRGDSRFYTKEGSNILEELEIPPLLKKLGRELSKGQRRRVQTAIGFLFQPKLFLFDEPFEGLDVQRSHDLTEILLRASSSMSCIVTSHRMDVIEQLAEVIILLEEGRVLTAGKLAEVIEHLVAFQCEVAGNDEIVEKVHATLRAAYPSLWVTHHNGTLSITGSRKDAALENDLCRALHEAGLSPLATKPTLVDAMNIHLRVKQQAGGYTT
jgi:ABC-2 type transport system ATP-binding protein